MSVACSFSQKSLDSPLSHQELYGVEHPLAKRKPKTHRKTKSSSSGKLTAAASSASSSSKHRRKGKRCKSTLSTVEPAMCTQPTSPVKPQKSLTVPVARPPDRTPPYSLAHNSLKIRRSLTVTKSSSVVKSSSVAKSSSAAGIPMKMHDVNGRVDGQWKAKDHSPTFGVKPSASTPSRLTGSQCSTTGATSLGLSSSEDNLRLATMSSSINVLMKRKLTSVSLPPYMRMPRRAFESVAERKGKGRPLTISDVATGLAQLQYRHVIVMSGAGISTSSGIPDFRTPGTGLYDNLQQYRIPDPMAIFDIAFFAHNPKPFFTLARELYPGKYKPNPVHHFIRLLQDKGLLLRNYTQNIDGLERLAGMKPGKLVEAHGSFTTASCTRCKSKQDSEEARATIFKGQVPRCKHKYCMGLVKPDIVFFGEDLPQRFYSLRLADFSHCDLLIVMGTSLEVEPFASLVSLSRFDVPRVLINREVVGPFKHHRKRPTDVVVTGDLVQCVRSVAEGASWLTELEELCGRSREEEEEEGRGEREEEREKGVTIVNSVSAESAVEHLDESQDINNSTPVESVAGPERHSVAVRKPKNIIDDEVELCSSVSRLTLSDVQEQTPSSVRSNSASSQNLVEEERQVSSVFTNLKQTK